MKFILPDFVLRNFPSQKLRRVRDGFDNFEVPYLFLTFIFVDIDILMKKFLYQVMEDRKQGITSEGRDLLNLLIQANENDAQHHLTDEEIVANTYIFMLAGTDLL